MGRITGSVSLVCKRALNAFAAVVSAVVAIGRAGAGAATIGAQLEG